jgi:hypothetical protein
MGTYLIARSSTNVDQDDPKFVGTYRSSYSNAIIKLSRKWVMDTPQRLVDDRSRGISWIPIEKIRLLHTEAPLSPEAFRVYLTDALVGQNDQYHDEDIVDIRKLIRQMADHGDDVLVM